MQKKPKCTCGQCNVCKTRERMRKLRQAKAVIEAKSEHVQATTPNKPSPVVIMGVSKLERVKEVNPEPGRSPNDPERGVNSELKELSQRINKKINPLAIWVDGNGHSYGSDTLKGRIYEAESDLDSEIRSLQDQLHSFSKKPRRGREYWYQWINGAWKYVGAVDAKHDPRTGIESRIGALRQDKRVSRDLIKSCVIKELGKHLLIDMEKFRAHVDKRLPGNIILVKDVIS